MELLRTERTEYAEYDAPAEYDEYDGPYDRTAPAELARSPLAGPDLLLRIKGFARSRLADPDLKPGMLARHHHISLRHLQKLFRDHGQSPAGWIRDERLRRSRAELRDPRLDHLSVAVIGDRSGLYGASHFSRLFRKYYGVAPGEYRRHRPGIRIAA
ncbi:hypothetical protein GCM10009760_10480 [Kitasatospora kazusensis]|uniref:HTH araC/xylS-type domain-containing protein n=1 Tax=Kitasatospora kazusensis TaxID=407974 RepID=A0ABN2YYD7_9ACTN